MVQQKSSLEIVRKKYKQTRAEKFKVSEKERKALTDRENVESESEIPPTPEKKNSKLLKKLRKPFSLGTI